MKKSTIGIIALILLALLFIFLATKLTDSKKPQATEVPQATETLQPTDTPQPEEAEEATDTPEADGTANLFQQIKTTNLDNQPFDFSNQGDRVLMLNVWADWCGPCRMEMPAFEKLQQEFADDLLLVGVLLEGIKGDENGNIVRNEEIIKAAKKVVADLEVTYASIVPEEILASAMFSQESGLAVRAFPTTWFVNSQGQILHVQQGALEEAGWRKLIEVMIDANKNPEKYR